MILDAGYRRVVRPVLFRAYGGDAERVHERTLAAIARLGESRPALAAVARLCARHRTPTTVAGIRFPGLVGLAAGMDKNGVGVTAWGALGFGHVELGTVTAAPQPGNDRPRLVRLPDSTAVINRMGFNNDGARALADRLRAAGVGRGNGAVGIPVGISVGKTKTVPLKEATEDYLTSLRLLAPYADYLAVNVSSPNTPGLRSLQDAAALDELVTALVTETRLANPEAPLPVFVKVAPDLTDAALEEALAVCTTTGVAGLIATNTTLTRDGLALADQARGGEVGGLSGAPLAVRARQVVRFLTARTTLPVIGVGGVVSRADGQALLDAGASLLQVYTGYIYRGPALIGELDQLRPGPHGSAGVTAPYGRRLTAAVRARGPLCVGIDPHPALLRAWGLPVDVTGLERCARGLVEALGATVPVFKPQSAFFEAYGSAGIAVLERVLADIRVTGALALLDAKRGDIGSTMEAYATAYLTDGSPLAVDAVTLSPYLGFGSLAPALDRAVASGRGVYVLALTSNPEGPTFQHARTVAGPMVAQVVLDEAADRNAGEGLGSVGVVVGATVGRTGADFSRLNGSVLVPGLGAQGGTVADLVEVFGPALPLVLPSLSREVIGAGPDPATLREAAHRVLAQMGEIVALG